MKGEAKVAIEEVDGEVERLAVHGVGLADLHEPVQQDCPDFWDDEWMSIDNLESGTPHVHPPLLLPHQVPELLFVSPAEIGKGCRAGPWGRGRRKLAEPGDGARGLLTNPRNLSATDNFH